MVRSYIAEATFVHERTSELSMLQAAIALGLTAGPAIQAAFSPLGMALDFFWFGAI